MILLLSLRIIRALILMYLTQLYRKVAHDHLIRPLLYTLHRTISYRARKISWTIPINPGRGSRRSFCTLHKHVHSQTRRKARWIARERAYNWVYGILIARGNETISDKNINLRDSFGFSGLKDRAGDVRKPLNAKRKRWHRSGRLCVCEWTRTSRGIDLFGDLHTRARQWHCTRANSAFSERIDYGSKTFYIFLSILYTSFLLEIVY